MLRCFPMLDVTIVLVNDGYASTSIGPMEVFYAAGRMWNVLDGHGAEPRFRISVLKPGWHELGTGYEWEDIGPRLRQAVGEVLWTVDERDVAAYDWRAQRIVLRPEAAQSLLAALHRLPELPERLQKLQALWSTGDLCRALCHRGFLVSLDGKPLYGGIFAQKISQAAIEFPVLYAAVDEERRIVLRLDPVHFPFGSLWDDGTGDALESPVDPDVRELHEIVPHARDEMGAKERTKVERFKRLILDSRVAALFAGRGTPAQPPPAAAARPSAAKLTCAVRSRDPGSTSGSA